MSAQRQASAQARATEKIGEFNAQTTELQGHIEENRIRRNGARALARLRASIAGRGVQLEGTPLDVVADQTAELEENALLSRLTTTTRAQAIRFGAESEADFARAQGRTALIGGFGQAAGSLLTGFSGSAGAAAGAAPAGGGTV